MSAQLCHHYCKPLHGFRWCSSAVPRVFVSHSSCPTWGQAPRPRCISTPAKSPVNQQLNWVLPENRKEVAQILDLAERAAARWDVSYSTFISPSVLADARLVLEGRSDVVMVPWGGYPQAERCRVAFGMEEVLLAAKEDPSQLEDAVAALQVKGNFMFDPASHRDFLGAILGTGGVQAATSHGTGSCRVRKTAWTCCQSLWLLVGPAAHSPLPCTSCRGPPAEQQLPDTCRRCRQGPCGGHPGAGGGRRTHPGGPLTGGTL
jgi:hypothetical protein